MKTYKYKGPVTMFGQAVCTNFKAETTAVSPSKALSNLAYQYKKQYGLMPSAKVKLEARHLLV